MTGDKGKQMAELALELFGSKMAAEFVRDAWEFASDETKQELADAVVAAVARRLNDPSEWVMRDLIDNYVKEAAEALLRKGHGGIENVATQAVERYCTPERIEKIATARAEAAVRAIVKRAAEEYWRGTR